MADRATVTYHGSDPIELGSYGSPTPAGGESGTVFEVDADVADRFTDRDDFTAGGEYVVPDPVVPEPRPRDELAALGDPDGLRGRALDDALEAAGLSTGGTVAQKRARLAEAQGATTPEGDGS